jgi:hypothetical protein
MKRGASSGDQKVRSARREVGGRDRSSRPGTALSQAELGRPQTRNACEMSRAPGKQIVSRLSRPHSSAARPRRFLWRTLLRLDSTRPETGEILAPGERVDMDAAAAVAFPGRLYPAAGPWQRVCAPRGSDRPATLSVDAKNAGQQDCPIQVN